MPFVPFFPVFFFLLVRKMTKFTGAFLNICLEGQLCSADLD